MFELDGYTLKVDRPRWLEIFSLRPNENAPPVRGGTVIFASNHQKKVIDEPSVHRGRDTWPHPPQDMDAWDDFVNGRIGESEWRDRQEAFGGSNGFSFILDGKNGPKIFETDRDRYDRVLAANGGDINKMPRAMYWTAEKAHYEPWYYRWQGVCTSNGGNFWHKDGNVIEIDFDEDSVAYIKATDPETNEVQEFHITFGVADEPADDDGIFVNGFRQDIHAQSTGKRLTPRGSFINPGAAPIRVTPPSRRKDGS
jgi:hypothetical protein